MPHIQSAFSLKGCRHQLLFRQIRFSSNFNSHKKGRTSLREHDFSEDFLRAFYVLSRQASSGSGRHEQRLLAGKRLTDVQNALQKAQQN
jgi:hypothetical protein